MHAVVKTRPIHWLFQHFSGYSHISIQKAQTPNAAIYYVRVLDFQRCVSHWARQTLSKYTVMYATVRWEPIMIILILVKTETELFTISLHYGTSSKMEQ